MKKNNLSIILIIILIISSSYALGGVVGLGGGTGTQTTQCTSNANCAIYNTIPNKCSGNTVVQTISSQCISGICRSASSVNYFPCKTGETCQNGACVSSPNYVPNNSLQTTNTVSTALPQKTVTYQVAPTVTPSSESGSATTGTSAVATSGIYVAPAENSIDIYSTSFTKKSNGVYNFSICVSGDKSVRDLGKSFSFSFSFQNNYGYSYLQETFSSPYFSDLKNGNCGVYELNVYSRLGSYLNSRSNPITKINVTLDNYKNVNESNENNNNLIYYTATDITTGLTTTAQVNTITSQQNTIQLAQPDTNSAIFQPSTELVIPTEQDTGFVGPQQNTVVTEPQQDIGFVGPQPVNQRCTETDDGADYSNLGTSIGPMIDLSSAQSFSSTDYCKSEGLLVEHSCKFPSTFPSGFVYTEAYNCTNEGKTCKNGACVPIQSCSAPHGNDIYTKGESNFTTFTIDGDYYMGQTIDKDKCVLNNTRITSVSSCTKDENCNVRKGVCNGDYGEIKIIKCVNGCNDGACIPLPSCDEITLAKLRNLPIFSFLGLGVDCEKTPIKSCTDGIQNQDETGIDCGGICSACTTCGNGIIDSNEECDDGNQITNDGCTNQCKRPEIDGCKIYDSDGTEAGGIHNQEINFSVYCNNVKAAFVQLNNYKPIGMPLSPKYSVSDFGFDGNGNLSVKLTWFNNDGNLGELNVVYVGENTPSTIKKYKYIPSGDWVKYNLNEERINDLDLLIPRLDCDNSITEQDCWNAQRSVISNDVGEVGYDYVNNSQNNVLWSLKWIRQNEVLTTQPEITCLPNQKFGDLDNDGTVTQVEVDKIARIQMDETDVIGTKEQRCCYDPEGDGVKSSDVQKAINNKLGISKFNFCIEASECIADPNGGEFTETTDVTVRCGINITYSNISWIKDDVVIDSVLNPTVMDYSYIADAPRTLRIIYKDNKNVQKTKTYQFSNSQVIETCTDSDGGQNLYEKGTLKYGSFVDDDNCNYRGLDYMPNGECIGNNCYVNEGYCDINQNYNGMPLNFNETKCSNGCRDGACLAPNLIISKVRIEPTNPKIGDKIKVFATITNIGNTDFILTKNADIYGPDPQLNIKSANNYKRNLANGQIVSEPLNCNQGIKNKINVNENYEVSVCEYNLGNLTTLNEDTITLKIDTDFLSNYRNTFTKESNNEDNTYVYTLNQSTCSDTDGACVKEDVDLIVENITYMNLDNPGFFDYSISANICNKGNLPLNMEKSSYELLTTFYNNKYHSDHTHVGLLLNPGECNPYSFNLIEDLKIKKSGVYDITVKVDSDNKIKESNEENNILTKPVYISACGLCGGRWYDLNICSKDECFELGDGDACKFSYGMPNKCVQAIDNKEPILDCSSYEILHVNFRSNPNNIQSQESMLINLAEIFKLTNTMSLKQISTMYPQFEYNTVNTINPISAISSEFSKLIEEQYLSDLKIEGRVIIPYTNFNYKIIKNNCDEINKVDIELRTANYWKAFSPDDPNNNPYLFGLDICVYGDKSINDLKNKYYNLKSMPYKYTIIMKDGSIIEEFSSGASGEIEIIKNGQCSKFATNLQPYEYPLLDKAQKIVFEVDQNNLIKEFNKENNIKEIIVKPTLQTSEESNLKQINDTYPLLDLGELIVVDYSVTQNGNFYATCGEIDKTWCKKENPNANGDGPFEFKWGDETVSCSYFEAEHNYKTSGDYTIKVRAKNTCGFISERQNTISLINKQITTFKPTCIDEDNIDITIKTTVVDTKYKTYLTDKCRTNYNGIMELVGSCEGPNCEILEAGCADGSVGYMPPIKCYNCGDGACINQQKPITNNNLIVTEPNRLESCTIDTTRCEKAQTMNMAITGYQQKCYDDGWRNEFLCNNGCDIGTGECRSECNERSVQDCTNIVGNCRISSDNSKCINIITKENCVNSSQSTCQDNLDICQTLTHRSWWRTFYDGCAPQPVVEQNIYINPESITNGYGDSEGNIVTNGYGDSGGA